MAPPPDSRLARSAALLIREGFAGYRQRFISLSSRARELFLARNWRAMHEETVARIDLYRPALHGVLADLQNVLDSRLEDRALWASIKAAYSTAIAERDDWELGESFFNSITRRIFSTVGLDPNVEFVDTDFDVPPTTARTAVCETFPRQGSSVELALCALGKWDLGAPFSDREADAEKLAARLDHRLREAGAQGPVERLELAEPTFYRTSRAYRVGLAVAGKVELPVVLAATHGVAGIGLDAVLTDEDELSVLFSFTRSHFQVATSRPYDLVRFLRKLMPKKRLSELYNAIGLTRHAKTEHYRDMMHHFATSTERFAHAPGTPGLVMIAFAMPGYDFVFKVIRDHFPPPKRTSREIIMDRYTLVFKHDRVGRMVEAQQFEHLKFDRRRFTEALLDELGRDATGSVLLGEEDVVFHHCYVERQVNPLNIFLRTAPVDKARAAIVDYGLAIKELAKSNIFPGDMLQKNFGVTRHGRVVFYDYDEIALLTECNFREIPAARYIEDEMAAEPWYNVAENDVFPEEIPRFLGLSDDLRAAFDTEHRDLCDVGFWRGVQERLLRGELIDIQPYGDKNRL